MLSAAQAREEWGGGRAGGTQPPAPALTLLAQRVYLEAAVLTVELHSDLTLADQLRLTLAHGQRAQAHEERWRRRWALGANATGRRHPLAILRVESVVKKFSTSSPRA